MSCKFTESQLESTIIDFLKAEGYPHVLGETVVRDPSEVPWIVAEADERAYKAG